jgi:hypothetical protein
LIDSLSSGCEVRADPDGCYTSITRHGNTLHTPAPRQPVTIWLDTRTAAAAGTENHTEAATATSAADHDNPTNMDSQADIDARFTELTSPLEDAFAAIIALRS